MTTETTMVSAGLIFEGIRDLDIFKIGERVRNALESLEQNVTGVRILSDDRACISSRHHQVMVSVFVDYLIDGLSKPAPMFLEVTIDGQNAQSENIPLKDTILAHALKSLHWSLSADRVKWVTPGAILSSADFVMATTQPDTAEKNAKPKVTVSRNPAGVIERHYVFPNIDETDDILNEQLTQKAVLSAQEEQQSALFRAILSEPDETETEVKDVREKTAPLRLSVWMVSFTIAIFALPVGAALLVFNIFRGENLRLSAQAAALTGTFIALDANRATAETLAVLTSLLG